MANRGPKKAVYREQIAQQVRRQHVDRELFTLDYLNESMNYVAYNNQSLTTYLDLDVSTLDRITTQDVKKSGLHFIQRVKGMKHSCDSNIFLKDLQEYGDFVNYDLPKSYQRDLLFIQSQVNQQKEVEIAAKRLKRRFKNVDKRMTSSQLNRLNAKFKEEILESLINNLQMVPEPAQKSLQKNALYRQLFNISDAEVIKNQSLQLQMAKKSDQGISGKIKATYKVQKQIPGADKHKSKKIGKVPKKAEPVLHENEQYMPKVIKKGKQDQNALIIDKPVLLNPQLLPQRNQAQSNKQSSSMVQQPGIEQEKKQIKASNSFSIHQAVKNGAMESSAALLKKEKPSQEQNHASVSEQKVKRKYTKAPKQSGSISSKMRVKTHSIIEKEPKQRKQREKIRQRKVEEQMKKREKKIQPIQAQKGAAQLPLNEQNKPIGNPVENNLQKQPRLYVSIAIQTGQTVQKVQKPYQIKEQVPIHNPILPIIPINPTTDDKRHIFAQIRIEELKQQKNNHPVTAVDRPNILADSASFQNPSIVQRQAINESRQVSNLQQSSVIVSQPFLPQNHAQAEQNQPINQEQNQPQNKIQDVDYFLN